MREYIELGATPAGEECVQVGVDNYRSLAREECGRYVQLLEQQFGEPPAGAHFSIKNFDHDFGGYLEVVINYDDDSQLATDFAWNVERNLPETWEG